MEQPLRLWGRVNTITPGHLGHRAHSLLCSCMYGSVRSHFLFKDKLAPPKDLGVHGLFFSSSMVHFVLAKFDIKTLPNKGPIDSVGVQDHHGRGFSVCPQSQRRTWGNWEMEEMQDSEGCRLFLSPFWNLEKATKCMPRSGRSFCVGQRLGRRRKLGLERRRPVTQTWDHGEEEGLGDRKVGLHLVVYDRERKKVGL